MEPFDTSSAAAVPRARMQQLSVFICEQDQWQHRPLYLAILELVRAEGTIEEVTAMAEEYAAAAKRELEFFPPSDAREALEFAPDFVLHRRS